MFKVFKLFVDPSCPITGRSASLCEKLLGIIPGKLDGFRQSDGSLTDGRVFIFGLLPDSEALKSGLQIGECLVSVNDKLVTFDNMNSVLRDISVPQLVTLTAETVRIPVSSHSSVNANDDLSTTAGKEELVKLIAGARLNSHVNLLDKVPHAVLYLTTNVDSETMQDQEDVIYSFPSSTGILFDIRGGFVALSRLMTEFSKAPVTNTSITIDGQLVHVAYRGCGDGELFLLCAPAASLRIPQLNQVLKDVVRLLELLYGSFNSPFKQQKLHPYLNQFFALTFHRLLITAEINSKQSKFVEPFFDNLPGARAILTPGDMKITIDRCLSEFEANDFADMSEHYYGLRRRFSILGSCLFFKGYLLASHLRSSDLVDVTLYLRYQCLLMPSDEPRIGQLIVWQEIYPTRRFSGAPDSLPVPGYRETGERWFLMAVALQNAILAVELETGGCAAKSGGVVEPDVFLVDQAKATLIQLDRLGVFIRCSSRMDGAPFPSLACADWFLPPGAVKKTKPKSSTSSNFLTNIFPTPSGKVIKPDKVLRSRDHSPSIGRSADDLVLAVGRPGLRRVSSWTGGLSADDDVQSAVTSEGSLTAERRLSGDFGDGSTLGISRLFKGGRKQRNMLTMFDLADFKQELSAIEGEKSTLVKLTAGCDNTLFHYVHFDELSGIFVCPTQQELRQCSSALTDRILLNFHSSCIKIHELFQRNCAESVGNGLESHSNAISELGVLFNCCVPGGQTTKKPGPSVSYWVVGRQFVDGQGNRSEMFVCFQDSAEQNIIEMAFKLLHGTLI